MVEGDVLMEYLDIVNAIEGMKCPKCGSDLKEINFQKVLIDKCDECKGIWLDAGELDLLIKGQGRFTQVFINKIFT